MKQEQLVSYFFVALFIFIVYQLLLIFLPFFGPIFWAAVLAFAFYPIYTNNQRALILNPSLACLLATFFVIIIVIFPTAFVIVSLMKEAIQLYYRLSNYINTGNPEHLIERARQSINSEWVQKLWVNWEPFKEHFFDFLLKGSKEIGNVAALQLAALTRNLIFWILDLLLTAFLLFFFFRDGGRIYQFVYRVIPMAKKNKIVLSKHINETFSAVIRGQLVTSIVQATIAGLIFWILDLPLPFLIGFLTFLTSMIPVTGAATIWAPFAIYLLASGDLTRGLILAVVGALGISLIDNFLKIILIGEKTKLPVFLLFLGILGGLKLYGFTGIFLAPIVLSLFFALVKIYQEEYLSKNL